MWHWWVTDHFCSWAAPNPAYQTGARDKEYCCRRATANRTLEVKQICICQVMERKHVRRWLNCAFGRHLSQFGYWSLYFMMMNLSFRFQPIPFRLQPIFIHSIHVIGLFHAQIGTFVRSGAGSKNDKSFMIHSVPATYSYFLILSAPTREVYKSSRLSAAKRAKKGLLQRTSENGRTNSSSLWHFISMYILCKDLIVVVAIIMMGKHIFLVWGRMK